MDKEPEEMGLSDYEYAFYTAIAITTAHGRSCNRINSGNLRLFSMKR
jgi:hypothetical protein